MSKSILKSLMMALLVAFSASCQQLPEDDGAVPESKEESLLVKVRSVEGEEVPYPLYLYAFTKEGELASLQTIADSEDKMAMELEQGE